jgi:S-adenosyl-L-methionine hydrolase (adenosine-forming)
MAVSRSIVFLSDFGYRNEWVGVCHAVINKLAPESPVVDLSHGVPPLDVRVGALVLADSLPFIAHDAVVLAVIDPSVGRDRDIAVETGDGRFLVGPDNGLLAPSWRAGSGVTRAVSITSSEIVLEPVSPSLHARDVLAPAAAHLATGTPLNELGQQIEPESLAQLHIPDPTVERGKIACEVLDLNRFGNVQLSARASHLAAAGLDRHERIAVASHAGEAVVQRVSTYADLSPGEWGLMVDPRGWLAVIRGNPGNAAEGLGIGSSDLVWLTEADGSG